MCLSGKDKGKKGKILNVSPDRGRIVVEKMNVAKKHQRPSREFQGGIVEKPLPISASKLMLMCPRCSKPTRVALKKLEGDKKVRACKRCSEMIDKA